MEQTEAKKKRGRPTKNPDGNGRGNRTLQIRLDPPDLKAIEALGGASWARPVLLAALRGQAHGVGLAL